MSVMVALWISIVRTFKTWKEIFELRQGVVNYYLYMMYKISGGIPHAEILPSTCKQSNFAKHDQLVLLSVISIFYDRRSKCVDECNLHYLQTFDVNRYVTLLKKVTIPRYVTFFITFY